MTETKLELCSVTGDFRRLLDWSEEGSDVVVVEDVVRQRAQLGYVLRHQLQQLDAVVVRVLRQVRDEAVELVRARVIGEVLDELNTRTIEE